MFGSESETEIITLNLRNGKTLTFGQPAKIP